MAQRLTDKFLKALEPTEKQTDYWDVGFAPGGSFGVRVSPKGRRSFFLMYRKHGRKRRVTVGQYPTLTLAEAREKARRKLKEAQRGVVTDLATFEDYADYYLKYHARPNKAPRSVAEDERIIEADLKPAWKGRKFAEIKKGDVVRLLDRIAHDRGAPVMANRVLALVSTMFNFALKKGQLPEELPNPCRFIEPFKEKSRERVLSDEEIKALWTLLDTKKEPSFAIYKLLLLTGQRSAEVKSLRWQELSEDGLWVIPAEKTKNGREHRVPLSTQALAVLEDVRKTTGGLEWAFPSRRGGHITWLQKNSKRLMEDLPFTFRPHDLRRTAATGMSQLGVDDVTIAKVLNHTWADRQITSVYNRWERLPEMQRALERWGSRIEQILTGEGAKVVEIRT